MPNNYDFSKVRDLKTEEIQTEGWISPLFVEYGIGFHGILPSYFWRVKGTLHTFVIPIVRMDYLSQGNYVEHFKEVLEKFREDYIEWNKEGWNQEWSREYKNQYSRFISL